ncbi:MAG: 2-dehydro-3-deoxygluconokinase, partial [Acidobacteriaceae bacterium]|nr:2-dehydro-3-deoxygluconokinase [Acidobacteriaceae bacterium]
MAPIVVKSEGCRWDSLSLGEVMLRIDPGESRIHTARRFNVWEGGGEYNVARGLRRCFGLRTGIVTAFADNQIGRLVEDLILQGGVDTSLIRWVPYDGVGRTARNGLNFTERGFGVRAAAGCSDRGHTAISQAQRGDFNWEEIFGQHGSRWFHTGGIFAALSDSTVLVAADAMDAARKHETPVSYDLNYRDSLWKSIGGKVRAQEVNRELVRKADLLLGNEEDFSAMLGVALEGVTEDFAELPVESYERMLREVAAAYPNLKVIATTLRTAHSASRNAWAAIALFQNEIVHVA